MLAISPGRIVRTLAAHNGIPANAEGIVDTVLPGALPLAQVDFDGYGPALAFTYLLSVAFDTAPLSDWDQLVEACRAGTIRLKVRHD